MAEFPDRPSVVLSGLGGAEPMRPKERRPEPSAKDSPIVKGDPTAVPQ